MTDEREAQIKAATPENPAHLTNEEVRELREKNANRLQHDVGAGRVTIPIAPGSTAEKAVAMKDKGMNTAVIALELDINEKAVRRMLNSATLRRRDSALS